MVSGTDLYDVTSSCPVTDLNFTSVWDVIEDTTAAAEAMKLRSTLMTAPKDHIEQEGLSQTQAAMLFG